ncbi:hypothetical protein J6590_060595 [Homalodisca vitripennis]|nr:hypothetical protein J6590_060595 [Homalodisca vitripennis]
MLQPITLKCEHVFCFACIREWQGRFDRPTCPLCRSRLRYKPRDPTFIMAMLVTTVHCRSLRRLVTIKQEAEQEERRERSNSQIEAPVLLARDNETAHNQAAAGYQSEQEQPEP